jgi:hypothetical protein
MFPLYIEESGIEKHKIIDVPFFFPNQIWYEEFGEGANDIIDRFGNMVLLETDTLQRSDLKKNSVFKNIICIGKKGGWI